MAFKKSGEIAGDISTGSDAWNVADGFTKLKILRQLIMLDRWDTIAQFGTEEVDEDIVYNSNQIKKRRVEALQRFHSTIKQLLGNVMFAMKKTDQKILQALLDKTKIIEDFLNKTHDVSEDTVSHEELFSINEKLFKKILEKLQEIKDELNTPLNNAGLIFRPSEEVDLDKIMNGIIEGG